MVTYFFIISLFFGGKSTILSKTHFSYHFGQSVCLENKQPESTIFKNLPFTGTLLQFPIRSHDATFPFHSLQKKRIQSFMQTLILLPVRRTVLRKVPFRAFECFLASQWCIEGERLLVLFCWASKVPLLNKF